MINTVSAINSKVKENAAEFINVCENEYKNEIAEITRQLINNSHLKIVLIAGPSGSGKTTTAHILSESLKEKGATVEIVSLDNFYFDKDKLPILPDGEPDTESVNALDIAEIKKCFSNIVNFGKSTMPVFNFKTGKSQKDAINIDLGENGILIVEGLHALNPLIYDSLKADCIYKIYISVNTGIFDDNGNKLLSSRKIRFVRRALRDYRFRNTDMFLTLKMWDKVTSGEEKFLYKFKPLADKQLVTLHPYELCVYRDLFLAEFKDLPIIAEDYEYAQYIANIVSLFVPVDIKNVPYNSLIREFIGDGKYNL